MINTNQQPKCADIVQDKFNDTEANYRSAREFFEDYDQQTEGGKIAMEALAEHQGTYYHEYSDLFEYINQTALSWDYVDGEGRDSGYYRLQLSYGGPSDEFRIYVNRDKEIDIIEYWFMDWFDGAHVLVPVESESWDVCEQLMECERWS